MGGGWEGALNITIMDKKAYQIPCLKALDINEEAELLTATLDGQVILDDDGETEDPWNEGLGKKNIWDEE